MVVLLVLQVPESLWVLWVLRALESGWLVGVGRSVSAIDCGRNVRLHGCCGTEYWHVFYTLFVVVIELWGKVLRERICWPVKKRKRGEKIDESCGAQKMRVHSVSQRGTTELRMALIYVTGAGGGGAIYVTLVGPSGGWEGYGMVASWAPYIATRCLFVGQWFWKTEKLICIFCSVFLFFWCRF